MRFKSHNLLLLLALVLSSTSYHVTSSPLILTCGSDTFDTDSDARQWEPDAKFLMDEDKSAVTEADIKDPSLPSDVPYMTARIFESQSTYIFPLQNTSSRMLLRLHFYPSSYPNLNISTTFFSVTAGDVTLLTNFSAFLTAEALSQAYIVKEYYLAASQYPSRSIKLTFTPSDDSFAFINGVELIPTPPEIFDYEASLVGSSDDFPTTLTVPIDLMSLETLYRLNAGGRYIAPVDDSGGLMRTWYDDSVYIYGAGFGISATADVAVRYRGLPRYTAPLDVYKSYRSMGAFVDVNKVSNLTWAFDVDPDFLYLVRFHWCDSEMSKSNQRVFDVMINNKTADSEVDLFAWTNVVAKPIRKDYIVNVRKGAGNESRVWVTLHPTNRTKPEFMDVLLNGLEIFKLSDISKSSLAGPNPMLSDMMRKYLDSHGMESNSFGVESNNSMIIILCGAGGAAAIAIAAVLITIANSKKKRTGGADLRTDCLPMYWNSNTDVTSILSNNQAFVTISSDAASNCRYFSLVEITNATNNFDETNVIGVGGFGKVYKGVIDGETKVAIKRLNQSSEQGVNEFQTEIEMLSRLRHRHLVSLIGFCEDKGEMILVYDYMGRGTLREHIYRDSKVILPWRRRLQISIGAARGLHYLHTGAKYIIIHRDVKTTNILLDDKWVAKVSDFGLSKTGPAISKGHVSTVVKGSFGYLDPEYFRRQQLTEKSDVYSFGVVLFEILCARPAINSNLPQEQISLADWASQNAKNGTIENIIDPPLKEVIAPECLAKFTETAAKCLADHGGDRPTMGVVLWSLETALQLQENFDNANGGPISPISIENITIDNVEDNDVNESGADEKNDETFSLYVNQEGR